MPARAILSDAGGILYDDTHGPKHLYPAVAELIGVDLTVLKAGWAPYRERAMTDAAYSSRKGWHEYLGKLGATKLQLREFDHIYHTTWPLLNLLPDVKETLGEFHRRQTPFIIVSDAAATGRSLQHRLRDEFALKGITDVITSKDVGFCKPDAHIFDAALQRHNLKKEDVLFLAHDYDELRGAHDLNIGVLALNYWKEDCLNFIPEERKLERLPEVLRFL